MDSVRSVTFASKKGTVTVPAESLNDLDNEHGCGTLGIRKKLLVLIGVMISLCFILSISALSLSLHVRVFPGNMQTLNNQHDLKYAETNMTEVMFTGDTEPPTKPLNLTTQNSTVTSDRSSYEPECQNTNYVLNPHSKTCYRAVEHPMQWLDAKNFCESAGEHLVTFRTAEAAEWFSNAQHILGDEYEATWIGLRNISDVWRWQGLNQEQLQPQIARWDPLPYLAFHDCTVSFLSYWYGLPCDTRFPFVCELEV